MFRISIIGSDLFQYGKITLGLISVAGTAKYLDQLLLCLIRGSVVGRNDCRTLFE